MAISYTINAEPRDDAGKGASRRLRRAGKVPAIVYGGGKDAASISLEQEFVKKAADDEGFYTHILDLKLDGGADKVVVRDVQRHPARPEILHVDFLRVSETEELRISIPLHYVNEEDSPAGKASGVVISHYQTDVEIICLPKDLPEYIEVDMSAIDAGDNVHLSDLRVPEGVRISDLEYGEDSIIVAAQYVRADQGERQLEEIEEPEELEEEALAAEGEEAEEGEEAGEGEEGEDREGGDEETRED